MNSVSYRNCLYKCLFLGVAVSVAIPLLLWVVGEILEHG
jgi:hypothetical protein